MTQLVATITCPSCDHTASETMPTNCCVHFYECRACGATMHPKQGDCCVFCSYADTKCPPVQESDATDTGANRD